MTRRLQLRDVEDPIREIVREYLNRFDIAAIHYGEMAQDLIDHVSEVVKRAMAQAYEDGKTDATKGDE